MFPIRFVLVEHALKHCFKNAIDNFDLPVILWVIRHGEVVLESQEVRQLLEEFVL